MAAMYGHGDVVQKLVDAKADVHAQDKVRELVVVWVWCVGVTRCNAHRHRLSVHACLCWVRLE